jgi:hypothetical protein
MPTPPDAPPSTTEADTIEARMARAREAQSKRQDAAARARQLEELAILELENRLEEEGKGPRGVNFEIVDGGSEGPIAVRLGDLVVFKRFQATMKGDKEPSHEDHYNFVAPSLLYPEKDKFNAIVGRRAVLLLRCSNALATLYGARDDEARGKF